MLTCHVVSKKDGDNREVWLLRDGELFNASSPLLLDPGETKPLTPGPALVGPDSWASTPGYTQRALSGHIGPDYRRQVREPHYWPGQVRMHYYWSGC